MPTRTIPGGLGFEARISERTQRGLIDARNCDMTADGVIGKRTGSESITSATTTGGSIDLDLAHAVWHRGEEECVVGGDGRLYSYQPCPDAWADIGAWTPAQLRQRVTYANAGVIREVDGQTVSACSIMVWNQTGGTNAGLYFAVYSDAGHLVVPATQFNDNSIAVGFQPRVAAADTFAIVAWAVGTELRAAVWDPLFPDVLTPFVVTASLSGRDFDLRGTPGFDDVMVAFATSTVDVEFRRLDIAGATVASFSAVLATAIAGEIAISPRTESIVHIAWLAAAGATLATREVGGADVEHTIAIGPDAGTRVTVVAAPDATEGTDRAVVAVEHDPGTSYLRYVEVFKASVTLGGLVSQRTQMGAHLQGHAVEYGGVYLVQMVRGSGSTDASTFYMCQDMLSGENIARQYDGRADTSGTSAARLSICTPDYRSGPDLRYWSRISNDRELLNQSVGYAGIDSTPRPQAPAVIDDVAHAAHGGYIRAYDGASTFEENYHELPEVDSTTPAGGGALVAGGTYTTALTWQWRDNNGRFYRSAPVIETTTLGALDNEITKVVKSLNFTEREGVSLQGWRSQESLVGDPNLYLEFSVPALASAATVAVSFNDTDATIAVNEALGAEFVGDVAPDPTPATDFCAVAGGRLFTGDPERRFLVRYSYPRREGFGMGWSPLQGQELPEQEAVTAMADQDGQFIAFTANGAALWFGDGPDATGAGAFSTPQTIPIEVGCTRGQSSIAKTRAGIAYGTDSGPRLLNRGRQAEDIAEPVERLYLVDGQTVVCMFYQPQTGELHVLDDGDLSAEPKRGSLRLHVNSGRWAQDDARRRCVDASISPAGSILWLVPGNYVLRSRRDIYTDVGGASYDVTIGTPWVRTTDSSLQPSAQPLTATIHGSNRDTHTLKFAVLTDYRETAVETATFDVSAGLSPGAGHGRYQFRHSFQAAATRRVGAIRGQVILQGSTAAAFIEAVEFELDARDSAQPIELLPVATPTSVT